MVWDRINRMIRIKGKRGLDFAFPVSVNHILTTLHLTEMQ